MVDVELVGVAGEFADDVCGRFEIIGELFLAVKAGCGYDYLLLVRGKRIEERVFAEDFGASVGMIEAVPVVVCSIFCELFEAGDVVKQGGGVGGEL